MVVLAFGSKSHALFMPATIILAYGKLNLVSGGRIIIEKQVGHLPLTNGPLHTGY
jgi:hypothetical protein